MVLQTLSAPSVLSLAPSLRSLCSVPWLTVSILLCISIALIEPLRRHSYQGLMVAYGMYPQVMQSLYKLFYNPCFPISPITPSHDCFVLLSQKDSGIHLMAYLLSELHNFC